MKRFCAATAVLFASVVATNAQDDSSGFVEANILGIFYHELGHAVIDVEGVPIFGQEEDAADVFSILLIDAFFEPDAAEAMAYDAALGFWAEAEAARTEGYETAWWDVHGPDEQRFFNTVCLFYGADPESRRAFASDLDLPEDRADTCAEEFDIANASWGTVIDAISTDTGGNSLVFESDDDGLTAQILKTEVDALNADFALSAPVTIRIESCGEANAFYDPGSREIVFCSEFEDHLRALEASL